MDILDVHILFKNYSSYTKKYICVEGFYSDGYLYDGSSREPAHRIYCPSGHHLDLDYYLKRLGEENYSGHIRMVGRIGNLLYRVKSIDRIIKVELLNENKEVIDSIVNAKISLPKELRGKI